MRSLVQKLSGEFPLREVCKALGASRSNFYARREPSARAKENERIVEAVEGIHKHRYKKYYGSPRIKKELRLNGIDVGINRLARLMKTSGNLARRRRRWRHTTDSKHRLPCAPNLLKRDFTVGIPNHRWTGDITYLKTLNGFLYLAVILDVGTRRWLGFAVGKTMTTELCVDALNMALTHEKGTPTLVHHDQGSQYASENYRDKLRSRKINLSMSRKGNCWDNAITESFFDKFKTEAGDTFADLDDAKRETFDYFLFYNRERLHSKLGMQAPAEFMKEIVSRNMV